MKRTYVYKIKPTYKQQKIFTNTFGAVRFIYNWGLSRKIEVYSKEKRTLSYFDLAKELTILKKDSNYIWLKEINNESLQQSLRNLENAYTLFFKAQKNFPKFKSKKYSKNTIKYIQGIKINFDNWRIWIPKCGWVKLCKNRIFDISKVKIGTVTIIKDNLDEYWCNILIDDGIDLKPKAKILEQTTVGIDLGIKDYAILSDGTKYSNPKFTETYIKKIKKVQKQFSKAKRNSNHYTLLKRKLDKVHKVCANKRNNFLDNLSISLIQKYDTLCIENLNIKGMVKNHSLAGHIQSAAWNTFIRKISYKAEWYGKNIIIIGRFEPSSKTCSNCGYINKDLKLKDREWICPICGSHHDRDINAAINIKHFGLNPQAIIAAKEKVNEITSN